MLNHRYDKSVYNEHYYRTSFGGIPYDRFSHNGHWIKFFSNIATYLVDTYKPCRTLDVGCAKGFLVESLRDLGVSAFGFDVSEVAISEVREDIKDFCVVGSIDDPNMYKGMFDLITCIEVVEHVPEEVAVKAIELMCRHADQIVFSSSPSDYEEPTHINVQPPEYWNEIFARFGFVKAHEKWPSEIIAPHTLLYRKAHEEKSVVRHMELLDSVSANKKELRESLTNTINLINDTREILNIKEKNITDKLNTIENAILDLEKLQKELQELRKEKINVSRLLDDNIRLREKLDCLRSESDEKSEQYNAIQNELTELKNKEEKYLSTIHSLNNRITHLSSELNKIKNGRAFKLLLKYWKFRDKVLPLGSKRREFVKQLTARRKRKTTNDVQEPIVSEPVYNVEQDQYQINWNKGFNEWLLKTRPLTEEEQEAQRQSCKQFLLQPLVSILLPVYKIPLRVFQETIESVLNQTYTNWQLCVALADLDNVDLISYLKKFEADEKFKIRYVENGGISNNTNICLEMADGEFVALLDHDDLLTCDALFRMVEFLNMNPNADFLYSDKDMINEKGDIRRNPLFKHKWSWPTMMSANYPTHFCMIRKNIFEKIGGFDPETDGAQDWDIFLKISEHAREIVHVPYTLYHWRIIQTSVASGLQAKPYVVEAQKKAINNYIKRKGIKATADRREDHTFRIHWEPQDINYAVIVYDLSDVPRPDYINMTLGSLAKQSLKPNKIYIATRKALKGKLDLIEMESQIIQCVVEDKDDWNRLLNSVSEDLILFLHSGVVLLDNSTSFELAHWVVCGEYPAASGKILYNNGETILNAGYVFDKYGKCIEPFKNLPHYGYTTYGSANWYREYYAVSELALMFKREAIQRIFPKISNLTGDFREHLIAAQLQLSKENGKAMLYNPYLHIICNSSVAGVEFKYIGQVKDPNYNQSVWDWNPLYLANRYSKNVDTIPSPEQSIWSGYTSDAMILATLYDFNSKDIVLNNKVIRTSYQSRPKSAVWFLPPFSTAFYGGIHTILRFAEYLRSRYGTTNCFVILGLDDVSSIQTAINAAFPSLGDCDILGLTNDAQLASLSPSDIAFCTLWTTAYSLLKYNKTKAKYYFLQDWEPLFYPAGSTSAQVEATYQFGFTAICNTISLKESYEEYGGKAFYFTPSVDTTVFYPPNEARQSDPYLVFLYGRPGNPRNGFELALPALRKVKEHFSDKVRILSAGASWNAAAYGVEDVIEHLGMLPYKATGELYRKCHVGLAMMMTRHPSYLPFELMACGCMVVANRNKWNEWMLRDQENCMIAEPSVGCISETIIEALENAEKRNRIATAGIQYIREERSDWNREFSNLCDKIFVS